MGSQARFLSRREFIKAGGLAIGAGALSAMPSLGALDAFLSVAGSGALISASTRAQVGVLLPSMRQFPTVGQSLLNGLTLGLDAHPHVHLTAQAITGDTGSIARSAETLLNSGADVVLAWVNNLTAAHLSPLFTAHNKTLVILNAGENRAQPLPNVQYLNLNHWHATFAAGQWARDTYGTRALSVASMAESGYDVLNAFTYGFEGAGGRLMDTLITHHTPTANGLSSALDAVARARPDVLYAGYAGHAGQEFIRAYRASGLNVPVVLSGFMLGSLPNAHRVTTWTPYLNNAHHQAFTGAYRARFQHAPTAFAVLGYDAAGLLTRGTGWDSPRGAVRMTATGNTSPLYLHSADGAQVVHIAHSHPDEYTAPAQVSGWFNPYFTI